MQTRECTVTFQCEGCGVRKPKAERYRPRSACRSVPKRVEMQRHRKRHKPSMTRAGAHCFHGLICDKTV